MANSSSPATGRVLGIDPGLSRCGLAVVDGPCHRPVVAHVGVVRTAPEAVVGRRLSELHAALGAVVRRYRPEVVAIERVLFNANARTAIGVAQAAGVGLLTAADAGIDAVEYTPSQVKATVAGTGDADKRQVGVMVAAALGLAQAPTPADAADALALALCHLQRSGRAAPSTGGLGSPAQAGGRLARAAAEAGPGAPVVAPGGRREESR